jgi:hypothetical protein
MGIKNVRSITDPIEPGTISASRSITDEEPDVHVHGEDLNLSPREAYENEQEAMLKDPFLSGGEKAELLGQGEPEETLEERLARATD